MKDLQEQDAVIGDVYDVCIIGGGPAGITLCTELADTDLKICLLESGGLTKDKRANSLRLVSSDGIHIKMDSRERVLGGASTTWSGLSATLDAVDMSERNFLQVPGWPITYSELQKYWEVAAVRYRFPSQEKFEEFSRLRVESELQPHWSIMEEKIFLAPTNPQRFANEFGGKLNAHNINLIYNATAIRLEGQHKNGRNVVERTIVVSPDGRFHTIRARVFVLATGGIENARLLLNSTDLCWNGLGNEYDQVGRYFMNHPKNPYGVIRLKKLVHSAAYYFGCLGNGYAGYAGLHLREDTQQRLGVLNAYVRFEPLFPWSGNRGVQAAIYFVKKTGRLFNAWKRTQASRTVPLRDYAETGDDDQIQNEGGDFWSLAGAFLSIVANIFIVSQYAIARLWYNRKPEIRVLGVRNFMEMEPYPQNRIILGEERDVYGQRVPLVRHAPTALDRSSLATLHKILAQELKNIGLGELESNMERESHWPINQDASHHLGSTRMGNDPATSVVNPDLRLHGADNVYCAGGSVFPTSGCANPTFTICALSIRLADHFKEILKGV